MHPRACVPACNMHRLPYPNGTLLPCSPSQPDLCLDPGRVCLQKLGPACLAGPGSWLREVGSGSDLQGPRPTCSSVLIARWTPAWQHLTSQVSPSQQLAQLSALFGGSRV